mmetsp:Transcript_59508/g.168677  ORF Transcript_59508/g.168677 Transcript_59508/m.168677 type:complete len:219 (+) Transcript_59508:274-930(+)
MSASRPSHLGAPRRPLATPGAAGRVLGVVESRGRHHIVTQQKSGNVNASLEHHADPRGRQTAQMHKLTARSKNTRSRIEPCSHTHPAKKTYTSTNTYLAEPRWGVAPIHGGATLGTRSSKHCALRPSKSYTSTRTRHLNSPAPRAQACSTTCTEPKHARTSLLLYAPALGIADLALVRVEEAGVEAGAELPVRERRSQGRGRRRTACSRRRGRAPSRQ